MEKNIKKVCAVCGKTYMSAEYNLDPCPHCGWFDDFLCIENPDQVIYRNLISFNKAKKLYKEGKPFTPSLNDFLEMLYFYREVEFWYEGKNCCMFLHNDGQIEFDWSEDSVTYFLGKEDFINNAKIGNEFVKDIWDKVKDPKYM